MAVSRLKWIRGGCLRISKITADTCFQKPHANVSILPIRLNLREHHAARLSLGHLDHQPLVPKQHVSARCREQHLLYEIARDGHRWLG